MRAKDVLKVVHSDICGPFEVPSLGVNKYFISFVDEYSRMLTLGHSATIKSLYNASRGGFQTNVITAAAKETAGTNAAQRNYHFAVVKTTVNYKLKVYLSSYGQRSRKNKLISSGNRSK